MWHPKDKIVYNCVSHKHIPVREQDAICHMFLPGIRDGHNIIRTCNAIWCAVSHYFSARNFVPYDVVRCRNIWYIYNILVQRHQNGVKIWTGSGNFCGRDNDRICDELLCTSEISYEDMNLSHKQLCCTGEINGHLYRRISAIYEDRAQSFR